jgi:hypothetical protein
MIAPPGIRRSSAVDSITEENILLHRERACIMELDKDSAGLINLAMDSMGVAVTRGMSDRYCSKIV